MSASQALLVSIVLAPGVIFALLSLSWLLGWVPGERAISRITAVVFSLSAFGLAGLLWPLIVNGSTAIVVTFGNWFAVHDYSFPLVLMADRLSLPFLMMTVVLSGLIGKFS